MSISHCNSDAHSSVCWTWTQVKWIRMKNTELSSAESTAGLIFCVKLTLNDRLVGTTPAERNQGKNILVSHQCIS